MSIERVNKWSINKQFLRTDAEMASLSLKKNHCSMSLVKMAKKIKSTWRFHFIKSECYKDVEMQQEILARV